MAAKLMLFMLLVFSGVSGIFSNGIQKQLYDEQERVYRDIMKPIFDNGKEVEIDTEQFTEYGKQETYEVYKFVGPRVKAMPLKSIFDMLQSWYYYIAAKADDITVLTPEGKKDFIERMRIFELNIGGKNYRFGIELTQAIKQILIVEPENLHELNEGKHTGPAYNDLKNVFDESGKTFNEIADYIQKAAFLPINKQQDWDGVFNNDKVKVTDAMRMFSVISQVAEGAKMSKDFFEILKRTNLQLQQESAQRGFSKELDQFFKRKALVSYSDFYSSSSTTAYAKMRELTSLLPKFKKLLDQVKTFKRLSRKGDKKEEYRQKHEQALKDVDDARREMSQKLPPHTDEFFESFENFRSVVSHLNSIGYDVDDSEFDHEEFIEEAENFAKADNQDEKNRLKQSIEQKLPPRTNEFFEEAADGVAIFYNNFRKLIVKLYETNIKTHEDGRITGAGVFVRKLLKEAAESKDAVSFNEFKRSTGFMETGGLQPARQLGLELLPYTSHYRYPMETFHEGQKQTIARPEPNDVAMGDGQNEGVSEDVSRAVRGAEGGCDAPVQIVARRRRKRAEGACGRLELAEDSVKWEGDMLQFEIIDEKGIKEVHQIRRPLRELESTKYFHEKAAAINEVSGKIGKAVGAYGVFANIAGSINQLSDGNYGKGAFSAAQALHSIGGLSGFNEKIQRKIVQKSLDFAAEKFGVENLLTRLSEPLAKGLGEGGKVFSRFLGDIPFVGLGVDIYFITEDIKDLKNKTSKTPEFLKVAHLVLDVETTLMTLVETFVPVAAPIIEPMILILTVIRVTIDDFYYDMKTEFDKVKGEGFGANFKAFIKGYYEGTFDVLTLGLGKQLRDLEKLSKSDKELFKNMANPEKYFNETLAQQGTIDFNGGVMSQFGGFLTVTLNNNGSITMNLPEVYTGPEELSPRRVQRTFQFNKPANDVVLGLGTTSHPQFIHKSANLWLMIPVKSYELVSEFVSHNSSRYGTYYGNNNNNTFFAIQGNSSTEEVSNECQPHKTIVHSLLNDYHYALYGREGDDRFLLGPQSSNILGNEGKDLYFIPRSGGKTIIDNFALDEAADTLFLNVTYSDVSCYRDGWDLVVRYCNSHVALIKHWFMHGKNRKYYRHLKIITKDHFEIDVTDTNVTDNHQYNTICDAVALDSSKSKNALQVNLLQEQYRGVKRVIGSNFSDNITGNDNDNLFYGGLGDDFITGGNGEDTYIFHFGDGINRIYNYAMDKIRDNVMFGVDYDRITVFRASDHLFLYEDLAPYNTMIVLDSWFHSAEHQHAMFISKDFITFLIVDDSTIRKEPITVDLSKYTSGVTLNLQNPNLNQRITISNKATHDIKLVLDSPHNDHLTGNAQNNILTCSGGEDYLQGNKGSDTYIMKPSCERVDIFNEDDEKQYDLLLVECLSYDIEMTIFRSDLQLKCSLGQQRIRIIGWFESNVFRHLMIKTKDKWTFIPPEDRTEFSSVIEPYQIERSEMCQGQSRQIMLNQSPYLKVIRFVANFSDCRYNVFGNELNNYIDPGRSNNGFHTLYGGNGSDTYVFGHSYGINNVINNHATDGQYDHLLLHVIYDEIAVNQVGSSIMISSMLTDNMVNVTLLNYLEGSEYQHLLIHSADEVTFKISYNQSTIFKEALVMDYSNSAFSHSISVIKNPTLNTIRAIFGSKSARNNIEGGNHTMKITGGQKNDRIIGGSLTIGEEIYGFDGDDYIDGKEGDDNIYGGNGDDTLMGGDDNDIIYGGKGADTIIGGDGLDAVVFSGNGVTKSGVMINLLIGQGWYGDAEGDTYASIESIFGSEYNDTLIGNDDNNVLRGKGGEDYIIPGGGMDMLQGGLDADIYDMKNAYGSKVINNFATDKVTDTLFLPNTMYNQMCFFFYGDDLHLSISYRDYNSQKAVGRILLGEKQLTIKILDWLANATYQHINMYFSDNYVSANDVFEENFRQLRWIADEVLNGNVIRVSSITTSSLQLHFSFSSINSSSPLPSEVQLEFIHTDLNSTKTFPISLLSSTIGSVNIHIDTLAPGTKQIFAVLLTSCNERVAISQITTVVTLPSPPTITLANEINVFNSFKITWSPPTDTRLVHTLEYTYIIRIWKTNSRFSERFVSHTDGLNLEYIFYNLDSDTDYSVTIASIAHGVQGSFSSSPARIVTGHQRCWNFYSPPSQMSISSVAKNDKGELVAFLQCGNGYIVEGSGVLKCNNEPYVVTIPPRCVRSECIIPSIRQINAFPVSGENYLGEPLTFNCSGNHVTSSLGRQFNMTCQSLIGFFPVQSCIQPPACGYVSAPNNGRITPSFARHNEEITFSCDPSYQRIGPEKKKCIFNSGMANVNAVNTSAFSLSQLQSAPGYHPSTTVKCVRYKCPNPLRQPHGTYSKTENIESGGSVTLTCNTGYYIRDNSINPYSETIICNQYGMWNSVEKSCRPLFEIVSYVEISLEGVEAQLRYAVPSWKGLTSLKNEHRLAACQYLGGNGFVSNNGMTVKCNGNNMKLGDNPPLDNGDTNIYRGFLTLEDLTTEKEEKVCVDNYKVARDFCNRLGYSQYTTSLINVQPFKTSKKGQRITKTEYTTSGVFGFETTREVSVIVDHVQYCSKMISCRGTCLPLSSNIATYSCERTLEGDSCFVQCPVGSALLGSSTRTCQTYGRWSGEPNSCDGKNYHS